MLKKPKRARHSSLASVSLFILCSAVFNAVLLAAFLHFYVVSPQFSSQAEQSSVQVRFSAENRVVQTASVLMRPSLDDAGDAPVKGSLNVSVFRKSPEPVEQATAEKPAVDESAAEQEFAMEEQEPVVQPASANLPEGVHPMLQPGSAPKSIEIGNFEPVTLSGSASDCIAVGQSLLTSAGGSSALLDVLVSNPQITISRICAANGTVIFTCRGGKMTISPRKANTLKGCGAKDNA